MTYYGFLIIINVDLLLVSPVCRLVHPLHVEVWSEESKPPVYSSVSLHSLEQLLGIVKNLNTEILTVISHFVLMLNNDKTKVNYK